MRMQQKVPTADLHHRTHRPPMTPPPKRPIRQTRRRAGRTPTPDPTPHHWESKPGSQPAAHRRAQNRRPNHPTSRTSASATPGNLTAPLGSEFLVCRAWAVPAQSRRTRFAALTVGRQPAPCMALKHEEPTTPLTPTTPVPATARYHGKTRPLCPTAVDHASTFAHPTVVHHHLP